MTFFVKKVGDIVFTIHIWTWGTCSHSPPFSPGSCYNNNNYRLIHGLFHIALVISTRPWNRPRGLMTRAIWKRPCINLFITYFARADNMLLPFTRGQITCYCLRKMLLPRRQITRRKLCFYYTCKFDVISIKYVIIIFIAYKTLLGIAIQT
jgi:hypothetical protein